MKKIVLLLIPVTILAFVIGCHKFNDRSQVGSLPLKNADRYLVELKENEFIEEINTNGNSANWLRIDNESKRALRLVAEDTVKFKRLFGDINIGLMASTIEQFPQAGFNYERDEDLHLFVSLPRHIKWDSNDYITIPAWMLAILIDENILVINKEQ